MIYSTERQKYRQMSPLVNLRVSWVGSGIRENGSVLNSHPKVQGYEPLRRNLVRTWEGLDFCPRVSLSEQSPLQETRTSYCRSHAPFPTLLGSLGGLPEEMPVCVWPLRSPALKRQFLSARGWSWRAGCFTETFGNCPFYKLRCSLVERGLSYIMF